MGAALAVAAGLLGCGDDHTSGNGPVPRNARDDRTRALNVTAIGDGSSTVVSATVVDARGLPTTLLPDEYFFVRIDQTDYVLVRSTDDRGEPTYRAELPPMLSCVDLGLRLAYSDYPSGNSIANLRVGNPFTIENAPTEVRIGDEIRVEFAHSTSSPSGNAKIAFEGDCITPVLPGNLQTYGSISEARFDTTNLPVNGGGCDVVATIMFVEEASISTNAFDGSRSPRARGIQQRSFPVHLTR